MPDSIEKKDEKKSKTRAWLSGDEKGELDCCFACECVVSAL